MALRSKIFAVDWSINWPLIYYKVEQYLLKTEASITKWDNFIAKFFYKVRQLGIITKWGKNYYKLGQVIYYKVRQLYNNVGQVLQSGASIITK